MNIFNNKNKTIFILPNIYESINGVSTKYIKFIDYLINLLYNVVVFTTFQDKKLMNKIINSNINSNSNSNSNPKIIKIKGLNIPFYKEIKIPIITYEILNSEIENGNEIIIFNGEFIWIYDILKKIKNKYVNLKLYPTMHTDYEYYYNNYNNYNKYNFFSLNNLNHLNSYLENKLFTGIIVTGKKMVEKYSNYTTSIFNANEVNLNIFNNVKYDSYNINIPYNIIYCGRISKEKNLEELLDCCNELEVYRQNNTNFNFIINIIGIGPYYDNLKDIIDINYKKIKDKIIFHGALEQDAINTLYQTLDNRIFLFTSLSETFGKTPMEAGATGIPIFIKKSNISDDLYIDKKNAFIFDDLNMFIQLFDYFIKLDIFNKKIFITNSVSNITKYEQNIIFEYMLEFLINGKLNKNNSKINFFDMLSLLSISKFINCSGMIVGD